MTHQDNPQIIKEGHQYYFQARRDGITIRERVPSHVLELDVERAQVYVDGICRQVSKKLNAACQFEAMKKAAAKENEKLTHEWKISKEVASAWTLVFMILSLPKYLWNTYVNQKFFRR